MVRSLNELCDDQIDKRAKFSITDLMKRSSETVEMVVYPLSIQETLRASSDYPRDVVSPKPIYALPMN